MLNRNLQESTMPAYNFRLVFKALLVVGFIIVSCVALINFFFLDKIAATNVRQIKEMAETTSVIVSDLALSSFYSRDKTQIINVLDTVTKQDSSHESGLLQISVILFPSGVYYASTNKEFQNRKAGRTLLKKIELNEEKQTVAELLNYEVNSRSMTVLQFLRNIIVSQNGEEKRVATVQVLFDFNKILKKSRETLFIMGGLILLLCSALIFILYLPISRTYTKLYEGMAEVTGNNFSFSLLSRTGDETGILFGAFNRMNRHLQNYFKKGQDSHIESLQEGNEIKSVPAEHLLRKTEITCLCARIPDIQEVIEKSAPSAVDEYITKFIDPFEKIVQEYGGQITKILGDKVYTLFEGINSMDNSVRMALKITHIWQMANHEQKVLNRKLNNYGIGLHSTESIAGSLSRMSGSYTFIGEAASIAERLCDCAQMAEILISSSMMDKTSGAYQHQVVKPMAIEDLKMSADVILITALPTDSIHTEMPFEAGLADGGGIEISKSSFESSITDMLEETLITSPLEPLKKEDLSNPDVENGFSDSGITGETFGDVSDSLWEKFGSAKKEGS
ncbi:MAG: adenylate/guanylate cyclase domain-containing protein [Deltaproteobacteria bacterium]|nr:adenylate/guanylate cyclase domain-containing protein [Deltaproteobacteria bacterium]